MYLADKVDYGRNFSLARQNYLSNFLELSPVDPAIWILGINFKGQKYAISNQLSDIFCKRENIFDLFLQHENLT